MAPAEVVAATAITLAQLAGNEPDTLAALLPAATTTVVPRETAPLIALCIVDEQVPPPPSDMLMTSAALGLAGTPLTVPPEAQMMASAMSDSEPPHRPSTRTGTTLALNAVPATPVVLLVSAATVPATWVPCQLELDVAHPLVEFQSPSSAGLLSRPLPSRAAVASLMKS